jgi:hypothetical protein|tara:strand:+ start:525 stop:1040 length:516 start_codon:yes stop_codon:yes gene_type:complete
MPANSWKLAPGLNNVGSYQVSGQPFVSGGCVAPASGSGNSLVIYFPAVTKWFQIEPHSGSTNAGASLRVGFSENGLHGKGGTAVGTEAVGYNFRLHPSSSLCRPMDFKVSELWFMCEDDNTTFTFDILAGLTGLPAGRTTTATSASATSQWSVKGRVEAGGSSWSGSIGVG